VGSASHRLCVLCRVAPTRLGRRDRAGWLVAQLGWMKLGPRPSPRVFATRLLPVVAFTAGSLYFGNVAYLSLSVAFIQILKARPRAPPGSFILSVPAARLSMMAAYCV